MTQKEALALMDSGASLLLTGAAGTGKTFVINEFIKRSKLKGRKIAITATTGLAATHLNGTTIHAWSGMGILDELPNNFFSKITNVRRDQILKAETLVIDEISMLHDFRLDMIEEIVRTVRESNEPFGGMQVILCGDFFQLPPVNRQSGRQGSFVTNSNIWKSDFFGVCYLNQQFRQADDSSFAAILNGIRQGYLLRSQLELLKSRIVFDDPFVSKTRLLTTNSDVDVINQQHLARLSGKAYEYTMEQSGKSKFVEQLKQSCLAPEALVLKKGALVMFIRNSNDKKYFNGSLGTVTGFEKGTRYPIVELKNGFKVTAVPESWELIDGDTRKAMITQIPLRLAWAITVHKSQGMTLDDARIDLRRAFVKGMGYVALSRVKSLENLSLDGLNGLSLQVSDEAKLLDLDLKEKSLNLAKISNQIFDEWIEEIKEKANDQPKSDWNKKIKKMRQEYPNAYKAWNAADDYSLRQMYLFGSKIQDLSHYFGRHEGAVLIRLRKFFGDQIDLK